VITPDPTLVFVGLSLLLAGFVKGATGLGFPLIATPTVAILLDIRTAITILIIPNMVMDVAQVFRGSFSRAIIRRFSGMFVLTVIGVFLGTKTLVSLPLWILNLTLGIILLLFVLWTVLRFEVQVSPSAEKVASPLVGFIAGFLTGMTNVSGPPLAIYFYGLKLQKTEFIKSIAATFVISKLSQLIAVSTWNLFNWATLSLSLQVTVFVLLGFYAGLKIQDRVNQQTFNRGLLGLLLIIGVTLIVRSLIQAW
jgi:uncharacterized membrane protein YfcA